MFRKIIVIAIVLASIVLVSAQTPVPPPTPVDPVTTFVSPIYDENETFTIVIAPLELRRGQQITASMVATIEVTGAVLNTFLSADRTLATDPHTSVDDVIDTYAGCDIPAFHPIPVRLTGPDSPLGQRLGCEGSMSIPIPTELVTSYPHPFAMGATGNLMVETTLPNSDMTVVTTILPNVELFTMDEESIIFMARSLRERDLINHLIEDAIPLIFSPVPPDTSENFFSFP